MADSHFAAGIVWRTNEDGEQEMLAIDYYRTGADWLARRDAQTKFPGGTNREFPNESVLQTLHREYVGETGLVLPPSPLEVYFCGDERHSKHFLLAEREECNGSLRMEVINDNGDWLSPPYWMAVEEIPLVIFRTHKPAFEAALRHLPS